MTRNTIDNINKFYKIPGGVNSIIQAFNLAYAELTRKSALLFSTLPRKFEPLDFLPDFLPLPNDIMPEVEIDLRCFLGASLSLFSAASVLPFMLAELSRFLLLSSARFPCGSNPSSSI